MMIRKRKIILGMLVAVGLLATTVAWAVEKKDMGGWGRNSPYNRLYNAAEMDIFKGTIAKIVEVTPMKGMSPGVALWVRESKDEKVMVQLCPTWFIDRKSTGLKKGDRIKVKGVWAVIDGKDIFMASKIKKGDYFQLKVRLTKDGTPFWTMTPAQLAKERKSQ